MSLVPICLVGGLLVLDQTAVLQILISQPLVAGSIIGWLLGDIRLGLHLGLLLQLLWLNQIPVGGAKIPEGNLASVIAVILVFNTRFWMTDYPHTLILGVLLYALLISYLGTKLITVIRNKNVYFLDKAIKGLEKGKIRALGEMTALALAVHFITLALTIYLSVRIGVVLFNGFLPHIPIEWDSSFRYIEYAIMGSGVGLTLNLYNEKRIQLNILFGMGIGILILILV